MKKIKPNDTEIADSSKITDTLRWLMFSVLGLSALIHYVDRNKASFGYGVIYFESISSILSFVIFILIIVILSKNPKALKGYITRINLLCIAIICFISIYFGFGYMKDTIGGTTVTTTNYYYINKNGLNLCDESGYYSLFISKSQKEYIEENGSDLDENMIYKVSGALSVVGRKDKITVEYYSNSGLVKKVSYN